jgi:hypothetical protein
MHAMGHAPPPLNKRKFYEYCRKKILMLNLVEQINHH